MTNGIRHAKKEVVSKASEKKETASQTEKKAGTKQDQRH